MDESAVQLPSLNVLPPSPDQPVQKPKKKWRLLIIILVSFLGIGVAGYLLMTHISTRNGVKGSTVTSLEGTKKTHDHAKISPHNESQIALLENDNFFLFDTNTRQRTKIGLPKLNSPIDMTFSRDGNTLFTGDDSSFVIYNLLTKKYILLPHMEPSPRVESTDDISPNNKYIVLTQSCCPGDSGRQIMTFDGKILLQQTGGKIAWSPDGSQLAISKGDVTLDLPTGPPPTNESIYIETIKDSSVSAKLILTATNQISFLPIKWIDKHTLLYSKTYFSHAFPSLIDSSNEQLTNYWIKVYENPTITFYAIDLDSLTSHPVTYQPPLYDNASYSPDKKWKVFVDSKTSVIGPVYMSRVDNSEKIKISDNGYAVWRP